MPPEQAQGKPVDKRADVYALGAILYHLLSGIPPYRAERSRSVLFKVLSAPPAPLRELEPNTPADLLAIVEKSMSREPEVRYRDAAELLEDLKRFQAGQLVSAYQYSQRERLLRFLQKHKATLRISAALLCLLFVVGIYSLIAISRAYSRETTARRQESERADLLTLTSARGALQNQPAQVFGMLSELSAEFRQWGTARVLAADARSRPRPEIFYGHQSDGALTDLSASLSSDGRLASIDKEGTIHLWNLASEQHQRLSGHKNTRGSLRFSPSGRLLASGYDDTLKLWTADGQSQTLPKHFAGDDTFDFSPDERLFADVGAGNTIRLWALDTTTPSLQKEIQRPTEIDLLRFSPDGKLLAFVGVDAGVYVMRLDSGEIQAIGAPTAFTPALRFSPDGRFLAASSWWDNALYLWSVSWAEDANGASALTLNLAAAYKEESPSPTLSFSPDSSRLAYATAGGLLKLREIATASERALSGHQGEIKFFGFSSGGDRLVSGGADKTVRVWELTTGKAQILVGHNAATTWGAFLPDGASVVSASTDGTLRRWSLSSQEMLSLPADCLYYNKTADLEAKHQLVACGGESGALRLTSLTNNQATTLAGLTQTISALDLAAETLAAGSKDHMIGVWSGSPMSLRHQLKGHEGEISALSLSPDERHLLSGSADKTLRLWSIETGVGAVVSEYKSELDAVSFSPDGRHFVASDFGGVVRLFVFEPTGVSRLVVEVEGGRATFSPDSKHLCIAARGGRGLISLNVKTKALQQIPLSSSATILAIRFSPDGELLAVASSDASVSLVSTKTNTSLWRRTEHLDAVLSVAFSSDSKSLATGSRDESVRIWDVESGESRALQGHKGRVYYVSFLSDDRSVLSVGEDGSIKLWDDSLPREPQTLRDWLNQND